MKKDTMTRKERALETKNKIYTAAEQLFLERGFEAVSIDDIVKAAGVSKGSFYVHFESKDNIISALIGDYVSKVDVQYQSYLDSLPSDMPLPDVFLAVIGYIADVLCNEIGLINMRLVYRIQLDSKLITDAIVNYNRGLYQILYTILTKGIAQGVFSNTFSADEMVKQIVIAYRGLTFEWCVRYPNFDLKEQALNHFRIVLTGICVF